MGSARTCAYQTEQARQRLCLESLTPLLSAVGERPYQSQTADRIGVCYCYKSKTAGDQDLYALSPSGE